LQPFYKQRGRLGWRLDLDLVIALAIAEQNSPDGILSGVPVRAPRSPMDDEVVGHG
jgi:hypothetical protein